MNRNWARPISEWSEEDGDVLWWRFPIVEPPYVGSPLDLGHTVEVSVRAHGVDKLMRVNVGGWPDYHTHWTPIEAPAQPEPEPREEDEWPCNIPSRADDERRDS